MRYPIKEFPGYLISKKGVVWSNRLGNNHVKHDPNRPFKKMKPIVKEHGHLMVTLYKNGKKYRKYIHRLVLESFVGPCPKGMECRHLDNNPGNNNVKNLKWGTKKENEADKVCHGTSNRAERNGMAKLTFEIAEEIRKRYAVGDISQKKLGLEYGVSDGTICNVVKGNRWSHPSFATSLEKEEVVNV